jgi:hypothetical protein
MASTPDTTGDASAAADPGDRYLRGRHAFIDRERLKLLNPLAIGVEIFFEKPWELAAYVITRLRPSFIDNPS